MKFELLLKFKSIKEPYVPAFKLKERLQPFTHLLGKQKNCKAQYIFQHSSHKSLLTFN
jgi:hypothetical protein